jgi:hypothetical protein
MTRKKRRGPPPKKERKMPSLPSRHEVGPTPETALKAPDDWFPKLRPELQGAALAIASGWRLICQGLRAKSSAPDRPAGKTNDSPEVEERKAVVERAYIAWCAEMGSRRLHVRPVLQIVAEGMQPHEVDRRWRQDSGWGAERLLEGLELYLRVAPQVAAAQRSKAA